MRSQKLDTWRSLRHKVGHASDHARKSRRINVEAQRPVGHLETERSPWIASHKGSEALPVVSTASWVDLRRKGSGSTMCGSEV